MRPTDATHNLLIVSDLHLSEGFSIHNGKFSRLEDFFSDQPFADFLQHHLDNPEEGRPWRLIIAGDLFDFLQVTALPPTTPDELETKIVEWKAGQLTAYGQACHKKAHNKIIINWVQQIEQALKQKPNTPSFNRLRKSLATVKNKVPTDDATMDNMSGEDLWLLEQLVLEIWILVNTQEGQLSSRTVNYGLGTSWQETIWKLDRIAEGHFIFFQALGKFASSNNEVVVLSGNHDIELFWEQVQERLGRLLADAAESETIHISFLPWIYYEPDLLYLEHGQQYEGANAFENILQPTVPGSEHLIEFPPGSMLVRYLFNKIEQAYPFADNLRPITRFFSWAFQNELVKLVTIMIRYFGGFITFVRTFFERSWKNFYKNQQERISFDSSVRSVDTLNPEAQSYLNETVLKEIDKAARDIRQGIFRRLRTLALLILVGILVLLFLVVVLGPLVYLMIATATTSLSRIGLPLLSAAGGFIFKQFVAPKLLGIASGEHYLEEAAERIDEILQRHGQPRPPFIIFGHNHEPDIVKVVSEYPLTWYVNTGSWLYSQGVVEDWLQQTKYHSFLKIVPGKVKASPELRFWNSNTGKPEHIRLRAKP